jgi:hypothetical protein
VPALQGYLFKVYALDTELGAPGGLSKEELLRAMEGCILHEGELVAIYERSPYFSIVLHEETDLGALSSHGWGGSRCSPRTSH